MPAFVRSTQSNDSNDSGEIRISLRIASERPANDRSPISGKSKVTTDTLEPQWLSAIDAATD